MKLPIRPLILAAALLVLGSYPVLAQFGTAGELNMWTVKPVSRDHDAGTENTYVKKVRVARQKNFDRLVFELEGAFPHYRIEYLKSNVYETEGGPRRIRTPGRVFLMASFLQVPADDKQVGFSQAKNFIPKGNLRLPSLWSIDDAGLFEGGYDFVAGLRARQPFRVIELSNPARLVIDFKR